MHKKYLLSEGIKTESTKLEALLKEDYDTINKSPNNSFNREYLKHKDKQNKKFHRISKCNPNNLPSDRPPNSNSIHLLKL